MRGKNLLRLSLFGLLILANYLLWTAVGETTGATLRVDVLNVGQGDAILLQTPTGENILVDGGPDDSVLAELGKILPLWDHTLDLVVATHTDADHITGLVSVLKRYQVKEVLTPLPSKSTKISEAWQQAVLAEPAVNYVDAADDYRWGEVVWDTLLPISSENISADTNNSSIVAKLTYQGLSMLLTGDMEAPEENLLMQIYPATSVDVLKVAHHGSKYSSGANFLAATTPLISVIEVGKNNYGHPTEATLNRLKSIGSAVYRTDENGTVRLVVRDGKIAVYPEIQETPEEFIKAVRESENISYHELKEYIKKALHNYLHQMKKNVETLKNRESAPIAAQ